MQGFTQGGQTRAAQGAYSFCVRAAQRALWLSTHYSRSPAFGHCCESQDRPAVDAPHETEVAGAPEEVSSLPRDGGTGCAERAAKTVRCRGAEPEVGHRYH